MNVLRILSDILDEFGEGEVSVRKFDWTVDGYLEIELITGQFRIMKQIESEVLADDNLSEKILDNMFKELKKGVANAT